jgi:hypothetical protein
MSSPSRDLSKSVDDLISDLDKLNSDGTSVSISKANAIAAITAYGSRRQSPGPGVTLGHLDGLLPSLLPHTLPI